MHPKKSLGQNFLRCSWVITDLLKAAEITRNDTIIEIGPGTGILTRPLAKAAKKVIAIEKDEQLAAELAEALKKEGIGNVEIIPSDILLLLKNSRISAENRKLIANIPYYLTSHLLRLVFEQQKLPEKIALTIQKEVAERICAKIPHMNLLALSIQIYADPQLKKIVPRECFWPKPSVDSAILEINPKKENFFNVHKVDQKKFFDVVKRAFGQKRKTIGRSLSLKNTALSDPLKQKRPQELSPEEWVIVVKTAFQ